MSTGEWIAAAGMVLALCFVLACFVAAVVYVALQIKKLITAIDANRSSVDALYKVIASQKETFSDAPALFKALSGLATRQVAETARLSHAAQRLADVITKSPEDTTPYYPPANDRDKSIAYGAIQYKEQGYSQEEAESRALVDIEQLRASTMSMGG